MANLSSIVGSTGYLQGPGLVADIRHASSQYSLDETDAQGACPRSREIRKVKYYIILQYKLALVFLLCMLNDRQKIDTIRSQIDTMHTKRLG